MRPAAGAHRPTSHQRRHDRVLGLLRVTFVVNVRPRSVTVTLKGSRLTRLSTLRLVRDNLNFTFTFASTGALNDLAGSVSLRFLELTLTFLVLASLILPL